MEIVDREKNKGYYEHNGDGAIQNHVEDTVVFEK